MSLDEPLICQGAKWKVIRGSAIPHQEPGQGAFWTRRDAPSTDAVRMVFRSSRLLTSISACCSVSARLKQHRLTGFQTSPVSMLFDARRVWSESQ